MKKTLTLLALVTAILAAVPFYLTRVGHPEPKHDIVILYDNDVHCAVDGYATMAALRDSMLGTTPYVTTVSSGDFAQGDVIGSLTEGKAIVEIMNTVPYDVTTIGNHEFDYGLTQMQDLAKSLSAEVLCANFTHKGGENLLPAYTIKKYGRTRVAYIGVATPTTYNSSTPTYFQDSLGQMAYDFHGDDTYERVQATIDHVRNHGADYVVILSHMGDDKECAYSPDFIAHTRGVDVVLDGHAHHVLNYRVANIDGDSVILSSTGTKFKHIGVLRIDSLGHISTNLLATSKLPTPHNRTAVVIDSLRTILAEKTERVVGHAWRDMTDRDAEGNRAVRRHETNLSIFLCDAFLTAADAQIGIMNGGGIRTMIPAGDVTIGQLIGVLPFNNRIWRMRATGQQLMDALEVGVRIWPEENGDFPHLCGARFEIDASVPSSVEFDENNQFLRVGKTRRIRNLEVKDKWGHWVPIDPKATYTIGGQSYIMVSGGASGAFRYFERDGGPFMTDVQAVEQFISSGDATRHYIAPAK